MNFIVIKMHGTTIKTDLIAVEEGTDRLLLLLHMEDMRTK